MIEEFKAADFKSLGKVTAERVYSKESKVDFEQKANSSELYHRYFNCERFSFDPKVSLCFDTLTDAFDGNVESYKVHRYDVGDDYIIIYYEMKTKKVMLLAQRTMLVIRYIQKRSEFEFIDVSRSVELMNCKDNLQIQHQIAEAQVSLASVHMYASRWRGCKGFTVRETAVMTDFQSSIGLMIMKPLLQSGLKSYVAQVPGQMSKFYDGRKYDGQFWFVDCSDSMKLETIRNRFNEDRELNRNENNPSVDDKEAKYFNDDREV